MPPGRRFELTASLFTALPKGWLMRTRFPALNTRVLTAVLVVAIPVLLIGAAIVLSIGQSRLHDNAAARLAQNAEYTAATVDAAARANVLAYEEVAARAFTPAAVEILIAALVSDTQHAAGPE